MADDISTFLESLQVDCARLAPDLATAIRRRGDRRRTAVRVGAMGGTVALAGTVAGTSYALAGPQQSHQPSDIGATRPAACRTVIPTPIPSVGSRTPRRVSIGLSGRIAALRRAESVAHRATAARQLARRLNHHDAAENVTPQSTTTLRATTSPNTTTQPTPSPSAWHGHQGSRGSCRTSPAPVPARTVAPLVTPIPSKSPNG